MSGFPDSIGARDRDTTWQESALCAEVDTELFFPEPGGDTKTAKKVCRQCRVRAECLADALDTHELFGVRGGLSERERRPLYGGAA